MQIVSYRGPAQPGGVSSLIQRADRKQSSWWHLEQDKLQVLSGDVRITMAELPHSVIEGHYRYSNEVLWPLMHGVTDNVSLNSEFHDAYIAANFAIARMFNQFTATTNSAAFVHDYQFAVLPRFLSVEPDFRPVHFWHIPWAKSIPEQYIDQIKEIARGLISCKAVGFHTAEYADDFANFVRENFKKITVSPDNRTIQKERGPVTQLLVSPAGIDYNKWREQSVAEVAPPCSGPFVLSVDRADYTKGIAERINGIDMLFTRHPELREQITFVFVTQRTRAGMSAYDNYWQECQSRFQQVLQRHASTNWSPIVWIHTPVQPRTLSGWYQQAEALLITSRADGLNLTAKEFIASTTRLDASLLLSRYAGVWHELKHHVHTIEHVDAEHIYSSVLASLNQPRLERQLHMLAMKRIVRENSWQRWWNDMSASLNADAVQADRNQSSTGAA